MKKTERAIVKRYREGIANAKNKNELAGIRIRFSQDTSANKLSWEEFTSLYDICRKKAETFER